MNTLEFLNYWGHTPGLPPKSTPMVGAEEHGKFNYAKKRTSSENDH